MKRTTTAPALWVAAAIVFSGVAVNGQGAAGWIDDGYPAMSAKIGRLKVKFDKTRGYTISSIIRRQDESGPFPKAAAIGDIGLKVRLRPEAGAELVEVSQKQGDVPCWLGEQGHQRLWLRNKPGRRGMLMDGQRREFGKFTFSTFIYPCGELFFNYTFTAKGAGGIETACLEIELKDAFDRVVCGGDGGKETSATLAADGSTTVPLKKDDSFFVLEAVGKSVIGVYWRKDAGWTHSDQAEAVYASEDGKRFLRLFPGNVPAAKSVKGKLSFAFFLTDTLDSVRQRALAHRQPLALEVKAGLSVRDAAPPDGNWPKGPDYLPASGAYRMASDERVAKGEFSFSNDSDVPRHIHTVVYGLRRGGGVRCRQDGKALVPQLMSHDYYSLKYEGFATEAFVNLDIPARASSVLAVEEVEGVQLVWQKPGLFAWPREIRQFEVHNSKTPPKAVAMRFAGGPGYCDLTKPGQRDFVCHFMPPWGTVTGDLELVVTKNGPDEIEFCFRGWSADKLSEQWVNIPYRTEEMRMKVKTVWTYLVDKKAAKGLSTQFLDPWMFETLYSPDWYYDYLAFADKDEGVLLWKTNRMHLQDWREKKMGQRKNHVAAPREGQESKYRGIQGGGSTIYGMFASDLGNLLFVPWVRKGSLSMWICDGWSDTHTNSHWAATAIKKGDQFICGYTTSIFGDSKLTPELFIKLVEETKDYGEIEDFVGTDKAMCLIRTDAVIVLATRKGKQAIRIDEVKEKLAPVGRVRKYEEEIGPNGFHLISLDLRVGKLVVLKRKR